MPNIKPDSLILAIQIVDAEIHAIKDLSEDEITEDDELALYECYKAAEDFKNAYAELEKDSETYPPYEELIDLEN